MHDKIPSHSHKKFMKATQIWRAREEREKKERNEEKKKIEGGICEKENQGNFHILYKKWG
jgi:hypothetical protein